MFTFLKKKPSSVLGVDIRSTSVNMLEVSNHNGHYCIERYGRATFSHHPNDVEAIESSIKKLILSEHFSSNQVFVAVPDSCTMSKVIQISAHVQEQDIEEWVLMDVEKHIPYSLDDINLDFNIVGPSPNDPTLVDVRVVVCRAENVERRVETIRRAGLAVRCVEVESYAIERVVGLWAKKQALTVVPTSLRSAACPRSPESTPVLDPANKSRGDVVVETKKHRLKLTAMFDIDELYMRSFIFDGDNIIFSCEDALSETSVVLPFRELFLQQIKRSFHFFYATNHHAAIGQIILTGGMATLSDLGLFIQDDLGLPTHIANPFIGMTFSTSELCERVNHDAPMLVVACGLALRRE